jgi:hypothetical protein
MKQLSKEQWRKIHGIKEPKDPADPNVVSRRTLHESIVKWEIKWVSRLHLISAPLAFFIVLFPVISKTWHGFVASVPVASWIHREFSTFGGALISSLAVGLFFYFYSASKLDGKSFSEYGYPINLNHVGSPQDVMRGDLYPRTRLEEKVFFSDSAGGVWLATVMWFVLFGGISIFIKSGGN